MMMKKRYKDFLKSKQIVDQPSGFHVKLEDLNPQLFDFQKIIVQWSLNRGRSAMFEDCGLGKTIQLLEWSYQVHKKESKPVLIFAPLAVAEQTVQEGNKFGISVNLCKSQRDIINGINISNYEKIHKFRTENIVGIVLDESAILRNFNGTIRNKIIDFAKNIPYRLACTATPAPNDWQELGNHAEFLGVMSRVEMLCTFFINDSSNTGTWRLKGHIQDNLFWAWVANWAIMMNKPSDLGFDDKDFKLPKIEYIQHIIKTSTKPIFGFFAQEAKTLNDRRKIRKETIKIRCRTAADLINSTDDRWIIWCGLNDEGTTLTKIIDEAEEVAGRHNDDIKISRMLNFADGKLKRLVNKAKIAGLGMNWQVCNKAAFVGLSDSWSDFYQAVRRIWRFGQNEPVEIHIFIEEREGEVLRNIQRKDKQANNMMISMKKYMGELTKQELKSTKRETETYNPVIEMELPKWI